MLGLTPNEAAVVDYLARNFQEKNSINALAKRLALSPNGTHKILKKLESAKIVKPEKLANAVFYRLDLSIETSRKLVEYVLSQHQLSAYAQVQEEDLLQLRQHALAGILFGSVLTKDKEARDIDILIVLNKKDLANVMGTVAKIQNLKTKRLHALYQTPQDLNDNLRRRNKVVLGILKTGKVLWGADIFVEALRTCS